jgi:hypothetical protein
VVLGGMLALVAADRAGAASVNTETDPAGRSFLHYRGSPGEANRVRAFRDVKPDSRPDSLATRMTFVEEGTSGGRARRPIGITLGVCTLVDDRPAAASCPFSVDLRRIQFHVGNGNDTVTGHTTDVELSIYGGDGNDTLRGGWARDGLYGEGGNDYLFGGRGDDSIYGGEGDDVLEGGAGTQRGLSGEDGNDSLIDREGNSTLRGGRGNDHIADDGGEDRIEGGAGNDVINARDGERDLVNCGPGGRDRTIVDNRDRVSGEHGCESLIRPRDRLDP